MSVFRLRNVSSRLRSVSVRLSNVSVRLRNISVRLSNVSSFPCARWEPTVSITSVAYLSVLQRGNHSVWCLSCVQGSAEITSDALFDGGENEVVAEDGGARSSRRCLLHCSRELTTL